MAAVLLGATHRPVPLTVYSAPAGERPAGASRLEATDAILPDGRTAAPLGVSVFVGTNPQAVALSPDGRYAIVGNEEQDAAIAPPPPASAPSIRAGFSLTIVDTRTMRVASVYQARDLSLFSGIAAVRDPADPSSTLVLASDGAGNALRFFALADGTLTPETSVSVPGFPSEIDVAADGRVAYVTSNVGDTVTAIDLANRRVLHAAATGFAPFGVARAGDNLYVANGGLDDYPQLAEPTRTPRFANVTGNAEKSSSLSIIPLDAEGDVNAGAPASSVPMDPIPDGVDLIGGARPECIVARRDGTYAYVSLANVDRVATVALGGSPHVVAGLDLRLFVNSPYGTQPDAEALSANGERLYVALSGLNAVAVLDARQPARCLPRSRSRPTAAIST
jgi:hypothetical protein